MLRLILTASFLLAFIPFSAAGSDPEETLNAPEIIKYHKYPVEEYTVRTTDQYILQLYRIPRGRNENEGNGKRRPVVFFQHGLLCSSVDWILNLPDQSAPFIFADAGFDVWLGNFRGCEYSKRHKTLTPENEEFWQFSWSDMAEYDLKAMINKIVKVTNEKQIYYVGHSQGTMTVFAKLSEDPIFAKRIRHVFALGPVSTVKHIRGTLKYLSYGSTQIKNLLIRIGRHEFLPQKHYSDFLVNSLCRMWFVSSLCANVLFQIFGPDSQQFNKTRLSVYLAHTPSGTSTLNVAHFAQMVHSGKFEKLDWGSKEENQKRYKQDTPPEYDLTKITNEISLFWGDNDWLATPQDIKENLIPKLKNLVGNHHLKGFNHIDFLWGSRAPKEVFEPIITKIRQLESSK